MNYVSFKVLDNGPKYNFVPWWTLLTILLSHQDNWKIDKCSYISTKNCITLLSDVFAGGGIMRNSLFFQIPRLITKLCLPFFYLFQYLSTKLTLQLYCKLILDSEKEQFTGKNWIKKEPDILLHYVEWLKKIREGRRIFTCIDLGIFFLQKTLGVQIKETFDSQYSLVAKVIQFKLYI